VRCIYAFKTVISSEITDKVIGFFKSKLVVVSDFTLKKTNLTFSEADMPDKDFLHGTVFFILVYLDFYVWYWYYCIPHSYEEISVIVSGFELTALVEPSVDEAFLKAYPDDKDELRRPMMLLIAARKNETVGGVCVNGRL